MTPEQLRLVEDNIPLVGYIVGKNYRNAPQLGEFDDIIQIGSIGLCKAAETYRPDKGFKFSTYAGRCIRNEIKMALRAQKQLLRAGDADSISIDAPSDGEHSALLELIPDPGAGIEQTTAARERFQKLLVAFQDEPVLFEVATGQMTQQEAAELLGISQPVVHRRVKAIINKFIESEDQNGKDQHGCGSQLP